MFLFALDQTVVGDGAAADRHRPPGQQPVHVGDHDLPADLDDQRPDLRQAVGPVRTAPDRHLRGRACSSSARRCAASASRCGSSSCSAASRASAAAPSSRSRSRSSRTSTRRPSAASTSGCSGRCSGCRRSSARASAGSSPTRSRWHWIFFINIPIGLVGAGHPVPAPAGHPAARGGAQHRLHRRARVRAGHRAVPHRPHEQAVRAVDRSAVGGLILIGLVFAAIFVWVESRVPEPIVPLGLFRIRTFSISVAAMFLAAFGFFTLVVFLPRWFQTVGRRQRDRVGLQPAAAPRRAHRQRHRVGPDRRPGRSLQVPDVRVAAAPGRRDAPRHATSTPTRRDRPVAVDGPGRPRHRPVVRGLHAHRPERGLAGSDRDGDEQPHVLPADRRNGRPHDRRHDLRRPADGRDPDPAHEGGRAAADDRRRSAAVAVAARST